jgi:hypothetical protein
VASSSSRHPLVLLGAAASLITVLGFFGVRSWPGSDPPAPPPPAPTTVVPVASTSPAPAPTPTANPTPTCTCADRTTPAPTAVSCVIADRLGDGQLAETARVGFGSKEWQLTVDGTDPTARLTLRFRHAGSYRYTVETETETSTGQFVHGSGSGTISCQGGQTFELVADYGSVPLTVSLAEA